MSEKQYIEYVSDWLKARPNGLNKDEVDALKYNLSQVDGVYNPSFERRKLDCYNEHDVIGLFAASIEKKNV